MRHIFFIVLFLCGAIHATEAKKPVLKFDKTGKFKIVQFTDVHYIAGNPKADIAVTRINDVLNAEKPDLVLFTGDVIFGTPAEESYRTIMNLVADKQIPFAVTFGNHDDEQGMSRKQLFELLQTYTGNLTDSVVGVSGASNFILPILSSDGKEKDCLLYGFDSHAYSQLKGVKGYDYIKQDQIDWYRKESRQSTLANGGTPIPAIAFFHIPLPEFNQAASDENAMLIGTRKEKACAPALNSGLFVAMKEMGDVQGVFVGHDHDNDYVVNWNDILLGYGRYTGGNTVYNNLPNGARIIELTENEPGFTTWVRLADDQTINKIKYPQDFVRKGD